MPSPSDLPPVPGSPTFTYASTANPLSSYSLPLPPPPRPSHAVLTKADLEQSQIAYSDLIATAKAYRVALASLSTASSAFGCALEACARLKEARADTLSSNGHTHMMPLTNSYTANGGRLQSSGACTADLLLSASGVHHLIANHQQILSETVYRSFEVPLLDELDKWRREMADEEQTYQNEVASRAKEIRRLEKDGLKLHKQRRRDLGKFREHLVDLTSKLDGLTSLQGEHSRTMLSESQVTSSRILDASCSLVRAEVDIFESLARKGWSGGGLDDLLEKGRDLFANDDDALGSAMISAHGASAGVMAANVGGQGITGTGSGAADGGAKLFSILPPKSILADSGASQDGVSNNSRGRPRGHGRTDSLLVDTDRYQSLTGAIDQDRTDTESIFSEFNQSRGVRPFSPQPIRRMPTDVMMDPHSLPDTESRSSSRAPSMHPRDMMDLSTSGFSIDEREEQDEEAVSPWKDEGLDRQQLMTSRIHGDYDEDDDENETRTIRPDNDDDEDKGDGNDTESSDQDADDAEPGATSSTERKSQWNLMG